MCGIHVLYGPARARAPRTAGVAQQTARGAMLRGKGGREWGSVGVEDYGPEFGYVL